MSAVKRLFSFGYLGLSLLLLAACGDTRVDNVVKAVNGECDREFLAAYDAMVTDAQAARSADEIAAAVAKAKDLQTKYAGTLCHRPQDDERAETEKSPIDADQKSAELIKALGARAAQ